MSLVGIGFDNGKLYLQYHYEEQSNCYNYGCCGDYNEETEEYEYNCEGCSQISITPAHDETYVYSGVSKEDYEELVNIKEKEHRIWSELRKK